MKARPRRWPAFPALVTVATVAVGPFVAFATGACGGKVLAVGDGEGVGAGDAGSSTTATGSTTASAPPTGTATGSATGTSTTTATATSPTGSPTSTSPPGEHGSLDGGVFNDGRPGSLVAIATSACTVPSAVTAEAATQPVTVSRVLAFCTLGTSFVNCTTQDGVQCTEALIPTLLFDQTCIDQCGAGEYVVEVDGPDAAITVPADCHVPANAPGFPSYCCSCGD